MILSGVRCCSGVKWEVGVVTGAWRVGMLVDSDIGDNLDFFNFESDMRLTQHLGLFPSLLCPGRTVSHSSKR